MAKRYAFHAIEAKIKTKKIIKTLVEIFKIWLGIIQSGISQVGIFRGEFTRGILIGWNFPGVSFPDTVTSTTQLS